MNICFCLYKLSYSGAETVARYIMEGLIKKEYSVSVVLLGETNTDNIGIDSLKKIRQKLISDASPEFLRIFYRKIVNLISR